MKANLQITSEEGYSAPWPMSRNYRNWQMYKLSTVRGREGAGRDSEAPDAIDRIRERWKCLHFILPYLSD